MDELTFNVALLTPGSDPVSGAPSVVLDLIFARAGNDVIYGYDPGSNDGTSTDIDVLFGDLFDNTENEFALITAIGEGDSFAILAPEVNIPSVGRDRFVLGDEFQPYYANPNSLSLLTNDFLGFNQFALVYDFSKEQDRIQLNGKKEDYLLLEVNGLPVEGVGTFFGEAIFALQGGIPDLVGLVVSKPEVDLDLGDDYFQFVGNKPETKPEEEKIGQLGTTGLDFGNGVAVDSTGNIYLTGSTSGPLFGNSRGFGDVWLSKYDSGANLIKGTQFGTSAGDVAYNVVTDKDGNYYLAGSTGGNLFGKDNPNSSSEAWVAKYQADGSLVWGRQVALQGAFSTSGFGLQVDNGGNVYLSGLGIKENQNPEIFNFTVEDDSWVAKFNSNGDRQWLTELDTLFFNESYDLAVDAEGNSYFVGWTQGLVDFGAFGGPGNPAFPQQESDPSRDLLKYDAWLTKVDTQGNIQWIQQFGSTDQGLEFAWAVDTDSLGNIYVSGWTTGEVGTRDKEFEKSESYDGWLTKFAPDGTQQWAKQFGSPGDDGAYLADMTIDENDNIFLTGYTNDKLGSGDSDDAYNAWAARFDTSGNNSWIRQFGIKDKLDYATRVAAAGNRLFVTGYTEGFLGTSGNEAAGAAIDAWVAQLKIEDGKLDKFIGNFADNVVISDPSVLPVTDVSNTLVTDDKLTDGDNRILTDSTVDYGNLGLSLGNAFDPNTQNSVPTALAEALQNDPSVFGDSVEGLKLEGTDEADVLMGLVGNDELKGKKGNDTLYGLAGNDKLEGEDGDDTLYGGGGADELKGGNQNDLFVIETAEEAEFDIFDGGGQELERNPQGDTIVNQSSGNAILSKFQESWDVETFDGGGKGIVGNNLNNSLDFRKTKLVDVAFVDGAGGEDDIKGSAADETFRGGANKDKIEGNNGNDSISGDGGTDELKGGKGNDEIFGGADNDKLKGEDGNDIVTGGLGNDEVEGGKGKDILIGVDPVTGFGEGEIDKLKGEDQSDIFVLGDSTRAYYTGQGNLDYGLLDDFKIDESDKIQLYGSADNYSLQTDVDNLPQGTAIFLGTNQDESIGIVKDVKGLTLTDTNVFSYV